MAATRRPRSGLLATLMVSIGLAAIGCADPPVGDPCIPEEVPEGGFTDREPYLETNSVQCLTRICMVYYYSGDPNDPLIDETRALRAERENRIYCTCRCESDNPRFSTCTCPSGYECRTVLDNPKLGEGYRGKYCVKKVTPDPTRSRN